MAFPVTLNGRTYTLADFEGTNYVDGLPDAFEDFVTHAGAIYKTTSTTSNTIGTGSKSFTTADNSLPYQVGTPLRISDGAAPSTNWMDGIVTAYSGTSLTVNVVGYAGSGTKTSWNINIGGGPNTVSGTLPVAQGGTGATTAGSAATNLGLGTGDSPTFNGLTIGSDTGITFEDSGDSRTGKVTFDSGALQVSSTGTGDINFYTTDSAVFRAQIASAGDISFYDSTGTSQDFFWDASASRLGIGTTNPQQKFHIENSANSSTWSYVTNGNSGTGAGAGILFGTDQGAAGALFQNSSGNTDKAVNSLRLRNLLSAPIVFETNATERMRIDSSGNVGIGTTSPAQKLDVSGSVKSTGQFLAGSTGSATPDYSFAADNTLGMFRAPGVLGFSVGGTERMRITSGGTGTIYIGTTDGSPYNNSAGSSADNGVVIDDGRIWAARYSGTPIDLNRTGTDGYLISLRKNGIEIGYIRNFGSQPCFVNVNGDGIGVSTDDGQACLMPVNSSGNSDNDADIGRPTYRFDDIYATNGTIQTSDANEKQDVAELDEAEKRVATAAKGLIRKFRWIDSVEKKGDDARIHVGVIAQDLQAAFEAEGLDPSRYAMFTSNTWWEIDELVPAVEAVDEVVDEEGRVITEAVKAKPEYTRKNIYKTADEAPEGAVERTRLGVRYNQLLAFIISAI